MLPHRSDTSRGHLHPPTRPRLSLPPSATLSLSFSQTSVSSSPAAPPPGWFLPCDRLCRHFLGGACASSLSLPLLPSPRLCNYQDPLATPSFRRIARRCNGHCLRVKSFHLPGITTFHARSQRGTVVYTIFGTSDRTIKSFYDGDVLEKITAFVGRERTAIEGAGLARLRVKTPFRSVRVYSNEGFPRCFISRYLRDIRKLLVHFIAVITSRLKTVVEFNYEKNITAIL